MKIPDSLKSKIAAAKQILSNKPKTEYNSYKHRLWFHDHELVATNRYTMVALPLDNQEEHSKPIERLGEKPIMSFMKSLLEKGKKIKPAHIIPSSCLELFGGKYNAKDVDFDEVTEAVSIHGLKIDRKRIAAILHAMPPCENIELSTQSESVLWLFADNRSWRAAIATVSVSPKDENRLPDECMTPVASGATQ